jgi:hypothetical protein
MIFTDKCDAIAEFDVFLPKPVGDGPDPLQHFAESIDFGIVAHDAHRGLFRALLAGRN